VAVTTRISDDNIKAVRVGPNTLLFFGRKVPDGVTAAELLRDMRTDQVMVRWRVKDDPTIHEMPFNQSDEGVMAALVAMKLTC
jgi:hypothetical protein